MAYASSPELWADLPGPVNLLRINLPSLFDKSLAFKHFSWRSNKHKNIENFIPTLKLYPKFVSKLSVEKQTSSPCESSTLDYWCLFSPSLSSRQGHAPSHHDPLLTNLVVHLIFIEHIIPSLFLRSLHLLKLVWHDSLKVKVEEYQHL